MTSVRFTELRSRLASLASASRFSASRPRSCFPGQYRAHFRFLVRVILYALRFVKGIERRTTADGIWKSRHSSGRDGVVALVHTML